MKKVLLLNQSSELYGSDRIFLETVKGLNGSNLEPIVVIPHDGRLGKILRNAGIQVLIREVGKVSSRDARITGVARSTLKIIHSQIILDSLIYRHKPSVIYTNSLAVLGGWLAAHRHGLPHVFHIHELIERPKTAVNLYRRIMCRNPGPIVFNSRTVRSYWIDRGRTPKVEATVIRNPLIQETKGLVSNHRKAQELRRKLDIPAAAVLITLVGRMSPRKGHMTLLAALTHIRKEIFDNDVMVLMVGSAAPGRVDFKNQIEAYLKRVELDRRCYMMPFTEDVSAVYGASDIVVMPSEEPESFGLVALEAMYFGCPLIASRAGALPEVVGRTSEMLFEPGDSEGLAGLLARLIKDKKLRIKVAERNREWVKDWSTEKTYHKRIKELIKAASRQRVNKNVNDNEV